MLLLKLFGLSNFEVFLHVGCLIDNSIEAAIVIVLIPSFYQSMGSSGNVKKIFHCA